MDTGKAIAEMLGGVLLTQALSSARMDETLARQAIKDNQRESHLNTLSAIQSAYEITLPEAFAAAKMAQSWNPGDAAQTNLAAQTPITLKVTPA